MNALNGIFLVNNVKFITYCRNKSVFTALNRHHSSEHLITSPKAQINVSHALYTAKVANQQIKREKEGDGNPDEEEGGSGKGDRMAWRGESRSTSHSGPDQRARYYPLSSLSYNRHAPLIGLFYQLL